MIPALNPVSSAMSSVSPRVLSSTATVADSRRSKPVNLVAR
jgi:hypothetical protein